MSLTIPSTDDLYTLWGEEADSTDVARAQMFLDLSSQLLWLATGIDDDPTDARLLNLIKYGMCDMAIYLYVTRDDIDANYAPFQSESIGSYRYSKGYVYSSRSYTTATQAAAQGQQTGVPLFDAAVSYYTEQAYSEDGWDSNDTIPSLFLESLRADPLWGTVGRYRQWQ